MNRISKIWYPKYPLDVVKALRGALFHRNLRNQQNDGLISTAEDTPEEKLMYTTTESQDSLLSADTVFPFTLFKSTVQIDRDKLTIIRRSFFWTADTISVQICDILNVEVNVGPFFGSVVMSSKYFNKNIKSVNFLKRNEAIKFQRLVQGSIIASRKQIDYSGIEKEQLVTLLSDLGQGATA
jgi:hypothetical protein